MPRPGGGASLRMFALGEWTRIPVRRLGRGFHDVDDRFFHSGAADDTQADRPSPAALISSMKHSCANVFCRRNGERSGPVKNGDCTVCASTRSLRMVPAPPHFPLMQPTTYEGTALFPLRKFSLRLNALCGDDRLRLEARQHAGNHVPGLVIAWPSTRRRTRFRNPTSAIALSASIPACCSITQAEP